MPRRAVAIVLASVVALVAVVAGLWTFVIDPALDSPQPRVAAYLSATSAGNEDAALAAWSVYKSGASGTLLDRRGTLTKDLATRRAGARFTVTSIDWWRTCCDPGPIADARNAGLARIHVATSDASGAPLHLVFEVWAKDLAYWGDAEGDPPHDWTLYEIHYEDQTCVFGSTAFGCARSAG